ncbi:MAG: complexin-2 [Ruminococcus flavefaciens]|nr:complexin-2 [Ruminococcus flavefaciens]
MAKEIKITEELFCLLAEYFVLGRQDEKHYRLIEAGVSAKYEALYRRQLYSTYKDKDLTLAEREQARQKYLEHVGVHQDFRWGQEYEQGRGDDYEKA